MSIDIDEFDDAGNCYQRSRFSPPPDRRARAGRQLEDGRPATSFCKAGAMHLTHGWEADLPADDSLLRRFVLASGDRSTDIARRAGGRTARWDDLALADAESPVIFDNVAVLLQPPAYCDLDDVVARTLAFFPPERHLVLLSAWPTPHLEHHGMELMGHPPLMLRPAAPCPDEPHPDLRIREVSDASGLADFVTTLVEAYPMPGAGATPLADPAILGGDVRLFVGYLDGRPVATSGARLGQGICDIEWVSTRPEARRRGIGRAITWAATLADPDAPAMLIASDDGQGVYESMGYLRLQRLTMWHRPGRR